MRVLKDETTVERFGEVWALVRRRLTRNGHQFVGQSICRGTFSTEAAAAMAMLVRS